MRKLCYLIILQLVIKITLGDTSENAVKCNCSFPNGTIFTPVTIADINKNGLKCDCSYLNREIVFKMPVFGEHVSTPSLEEKLLQRLDSLEESVKLLVKENEKIDTLISSLNGIETSIKYNVYPRNCVEARFSGIYNIQAEKYGSKPFEAYCEEHLYDGDWTVVARRMDGSVNFDRNWTDYKNGFGDLNGEFFIGLDKLYALTNGIYMQELIIVLENFEYKRKYVKYSAFAIGDESEEYIIKALGESVGDADLSFTIRRNQTFKIKERTENSSKYGAWWYNELPFQSNLFSSYLKGDVDESNKGKGVLWYGWRGHKYSLQTAHMMIRPKRT